VTLRSRAPRQTGFALTSTRKSRPPRLRAVRSALYRFDSHFHAPDLECFDHVNIFVRDREASERWYAEVLGLTRIPELEFWAAGSGPLTLTNPSGTIHLALFERPPQPCRTVVALSVDAPEFIARQRHLSKALDSPVEAVDHEVAWWSGGIARNPRSTAKAQAFRG
jgi:catechol 2,3-dioxygenase-like lactoylglutathione lyase family enzyme